MSLESSHVIRAARSGVLALIGLALLFSRRANAFFH